MICPGVEGENLAARALAALREARLASGRRCGSRSRSGSRSPPGLGGGSADAAAVLRLARRRGRPDLAAGIAAALGADVPSQLRPALALVGGAGERVEPLPEPAPHAAVLLPDGGGLGTADVFAEADRLGLGRGPEELERLADAPARAPPAPAPRRSPTRELLVNDLEPAGPLAAPGDRRRPRRAARGRRPGRPPQRLRPDRGRALPRPRPPRGAAAAALDRDDAIVCEAGQGAMRLPGEGRGAGSSRKHLLIAIAAAIVAVGYYLHQPASSAASTCRACWKTSPTRSAPGPTCWSASSPSPRPAPSSASSSPARR